MFKVAIVADIHGNAYALKAVMADIKLQDPDLVVFAGDLASKGPHPAECVDLVIHSGHPCIVGNTDLDILNKNGAEEAWIRERLGPDKLNFLQSLPQQRRITPPDGEGHLDDLLIVHSTPRSCYDLLILKPSNESPGAGLLKPTPAEKAFRMLANARANLIVYGHVHFIGQGVFNGQRVESVGAVGFPFDGDHRAAYGMAIWNRDRSMWSLEHHRVAYDHKQTIAEFKRSTHPYPSRSIRMLENARWYPGDPKKAKSGPE
ncbi:MAG: metallophosphoesterase [Chloroflexota bacterium]